MTDLDHLFTFNNLLHEFRKIERTILVNGSERLENDVEHSYMLAMLAWYIISTHKLDLDLNKVFIYALAHDLVEIYAGDIFFYSQVNDGVREDKVKREYEAAMRLKREFPEFQILHESIENYEKREDEESKFVYALDKIQPVLNIYSDGGRTWRVNKVMFEMIKVGKIDKVKAHPLIDKYFKELLEILEREAERLF